MIKIPSVALFILALNGAPASAANLMLDFGATAAAAPYLTLSPGHGSGAVGTGETSWNTISSATAPASLTYGDGTVATGVTLALGQEATAGSNIINFATSISRVDLAGSGGAVANQKSLLTTSSIYGTNTSSTAVGRDGFFGGTGASIGLRVNGLAAGNYQIYVMARNTNSNDVGGAINVYASTGASSGTFNFGALSAVSQSNIAYANSAYTDQYTRFINGENYVVIDLTIAAGDSLFLSTEGGGADARGFLNMVQIVQVPEPVSCVLLGSGFLLFGFRRRR